MPEERLTTVVIGKIHISEWIRDEFESRIVELLSFREKYRKPQKKGSNKFLWAFGDFCAKDLNDEKVIFARLGKNKQEIMENVFDDENWSYKRIARDLPKADAYSNFIILMKSHTIIFEEKQPVISIKQFSDMFSLIYSQHFSDLSKLKIDLIVEKETIFSKIREFDKITEVQLTVSPSNPYIDEDFRPFDKLLKDGNVEEAKLIYKNPDGLKIDNTIIGQGIALSAAGYGNHTITAEKDEETEYIRSKDQIQRFGVAASDDPDSIIDNYYKKYMDFLHRGDPL
nr:DUF4747 family protein [Methanothrix sp.]